MGTPHILILIELAFLLADSKTFAESLPDYSNKSFTLFSTGIGTGSGSKFGGYFNIR